MKFFSFFLFFIGTFTNVYSQSCSTTWPYLYKDFIDGTVYFTNGQQSVQKINIHVLKSALHFLDKNVIREALTKDIVMAKIGEDVYYSKNGQMMKVVKSNNNGFIALVQLGDFEALLNNGTAAYGASANSSAIKKLSSIEIGGISNTNHMEIKFNKDNGREVLLINKYFIVTKSSICTASKSGIEGVITESKKRELNQFIKNNKIQWKKLETLLPLIDFINY